MTFSAVQRFFGIAQPSVFSRISSNTRVSSAWLDCMYAFTSPPARTKRSHQSNDPIRRPSSFYPILQFCIVQFAMPPHIPQAAKSHLFQNFLRLCHTPRHPRRNAYPKRSRRVLRPSPIRNYNLSGDWFKIAEASRWGIRGFTSSHANASARSS